MMDALALLASLALAASPAAGRFSGMATLEPPEPVSPDARYRVEAELLAGDRTQSVGRYALDARLDAGAAAKALAATAACGVLGDNVFKDSFETP